MQYQLGTQQRQQAAHIASMAYTETTRYLCAAAHLDKAFRNYVISQIVEAKHKAVGELYGMDIVTIVNWCFAARLRTRIRDFILFLILLTAVYISIQNFTHNTPDPIFFIYNFYNYYIKPLPVYNFLLIAALIIVSLSGYALIPIFLAAVFFFHPLVWTFIAAWLVVLIEIGITYYGPYGRQLTRRRFGMHKIREHPLDSAVEARLRYLSHVQDGNVVVYSGYLPFVGAGSDVGGWSFTVDISKGARRAGATLAPIPFNVQEFYDAIASSINGLGLNNLKIEDKLYVNGQEIRDDKRFLYNPFSSPYVRIDPALMQQFVGKPDEFIRYYKCIRVTSWKGELILSIFVRFVPVGKNLFIEADYLLLPPLHEKYYAVDTILPLLSLPKIGKLLLMSFFQTFAFWFLSFIRVLAIICHGLFVVVKHWLTWWQIWQNPAFDYGAKSSLREVASSTDFRRYFQRLDKEMYIKIIENQLLTSITRFLDAKNIDTSELKERQEMILNNGVIVSGGSFQANNLAVGVRAKATFSSLTKSARRAVKGNRVKNR